MTEEQDDSRSEKNRSDVRFDDGPDSENGQVRGRLLLKKAATAALEKYVDDVIKNIVGNIQDKHLPSVKLLMDMADYLERKSPTAAEFESFARLLMKEYLREQEDHKQQEKAKEPEAGVTICGEPGSLTVEPCEE